MLSTPSHWKENEKIPGLISTMAGIMGKVKAPLLQRVIKWLASGQGLPNFLIEPS